VAPASTAPRRLQGTYVAKLLSAERPAGVVCADAARVFGGVRGFRGYGLAARVRRPGRRGEQLRPVRQPCGPRTHADRTPARDTPSSCCTRKSLSIPRVFHHDAGRGRPQEGSQDRPGRCTQAPPSSRPGSGLRCRRGGSVKYHFRLRCLLRTPFRASTEPAAAAAMF